MGKYYGSKTYRINDNLTLDCVTQTTNYGFRHLVDLKLDGRIIDHAKACYYNRTWEAYDYQSIIHRVVDNSNLEDKKAIKKQVDAQATGEIDDNFKTIGAVMALGDIFGADQKQSNDWKTRMLKAGLDGRGLIVPDDWEELSEEDKQQRLDNIINEFTKVK